MQSITKGKYPGIAKVTMLPIIDMNPNNITGIYSTLRFIIQQAKHLRIDTPVLTDRSIDTIKIVQAYC